MSKPLFRVYVDETGDRGWGGRSSEVFVLSAVIVEDRLEKECRSVLNEINSTLKRPPGKVLHWAENVKVHSQRKYVAQELERCPATLVNVVVMKKPLMGTGTGLRDPVRQYNYPVRLLLERVSWFVDDAGGEAILTFAHIRRFPYAKLTEYLDLLERRPTEIRWRAFRGRPRMDQPQRWQMLQMADLVAGCVYAAVRADEYGNYEPTYLMSIAPRVYRRGAGALTSYGFKVVGPPGCVESYPWWNDFRAVCDSQLSA